MYFKETGTYDTPNGRRVTMHYRTGTNVHNTLWASLNEDEYHLRGEHFTGTAIDVGGYLGSVGIGLAVDNPDLSVVIIEPVPPNADLTFDIELVDFMPLAEAERRFQTLQMMMQQQQQQGGEGAQAGEAAPAEPAAPAQ